MENQSQSEQAPAVCERLLTPGDICEILRVSRSFAYHLLQRGAIPTVRLGKARRVRPADLAEFVEKNLHRQG